MGGSRATCSQNFRPLAAVVQERLPFKTIIMSLKSLNQLAPPLVSTCKCTRLSMFLLLQGTQLKQSVFYTPFLTLSLPPAFLNNEFCLITGRGAKNLDISHMKSRFLAAIKVFEQNQGKQVIKSRKMTSRPKNLIW